MWKWFKNLFVPHWDYYDDSANKGLAEVANITPAQQIPVIESAVTGKGAGGAYTPSVTNSTAEKELEEMRKLKKKVDAKKKKTTYSESRRSDSSSGYTSSYDYGSSSSSYDSGSSSSSSGYDGGSSGGGGSDSSF